MMNVYRFEFRDACEGYDEYVVASSYEKAIKSFQNVFPEKSQYLVKITQVNERPALTVQR